MIGNSGERMMRGNNEGTVRWGGFVRATRLLREWEFAQLSLLKITKWRVLASGHFEAGVSKSVLSFSVFI